MKRSRTGIVLLYLSFLAGFLFVEVPAAEGQGSLAKGPRLLLMPLETHDISDEEARVMVIFLQRALEERGTFEVIAPDEAWQALRDREIEDLVNQGIGYFQSAKLDRAAQSLNTALNLIEREPVRLNDGQWLVAIHLYLGMIYQNSGFPDQAVEAFRRVVEVQPEKRLDPSFFSPEIIEMFNDVQRKIRALPRGSLEISSTPAGAAVYLDGFLEGVTPLEIADLVIGRHYLRLEKEGYRTWTTSFVADWTNPLHFSPRLEAIDRFEAALRNGEKLKADFVFLGSLFFTEGEYSIESKLIDVKLRKSYPLPRQASLSPTDLATLIAARMEPSERPSSPPAVRATPPPPLPTARSWYRNPWMWGGIGLLIGAGSALAVTLSASSADANPDGNGGNESPAVETGDVLVQWP
ncbi:MAG: PEGA domain-containing protein [Deltaproteobacteria bacterium]|nr:MAG: PEGA domain-containing protein [Deltaproteobacteria bacterium]